MPAAPPYRVVQWATGNIGSRTLRGVIEHPGLELAGVYAHSPAKAGRDAGELCGLDPTGVRATSDLDEILALGADCVVYTPLACDFDDVCRVLESGTNVVSTRGEFARPANLDPDVRKRVEEACVRGGTTIHSTGSSPGFVTEALPLVLTSIQRRLDGVRIDEFADLSQRNSPALLFDVMGFGKPPTEFGERRLTALRNSFGPSLQVLAEALGVPLDTVDAEGEFAVTPRPLTIAAGTLEPGTVAAQRITVTGRRNGEALLTFCATWYCHADLETEWDLRATGWRVTVDGDAPLHVDLFFPFPLEHMAERSPGYTANRAVNAVPVVCAAPPGIRTTVDLPQIVADLRGSRQ
ncbi:dihydrodipicolinate reductase [Cryptosporangium aurantiacum]|uniref:4-hydroxy-tetrahydrodipicolinate reductase n=1 Tax=Cryptosporangium aurantiacum TaxID=134849 RepID=A0A1M7KHM7_9ACTN|nr:dihydrodipicolinate reductase [Cryptosporangium aurantiacum]SHM64878.1 4-hydroxy-tetrahydrodipicolinate reductase [Cryptosporangium aurantiacum]